MAITTLGRVERGGKLLIDDLDLEAAFLEQPLDLGTLRCLQFMHDIESHTVCYLRDVLVTRAHADPEITAFLTTWNYEEHWHGEALGRVLRAHHAPGGPDRVTEVRARRPRRDRMRPLAFMAASAALPDITAIHMTWGAINEWTTQAGYARLSATADHPMLTELLRRIMRQEGTHVAYYSSEARRRLEASSSSRRITRFALQHLWRPVGSGVRPDAEVDHVIVSLFGGDEGHDAASRIDRNIDRLPGLAGLLLVGRARRRALDAAA